MPKYAMVRAILAFFLYPRLSLPGVQTADWIGSRSSLYHTSRRHNKLHSGRKLTVLFRSVHYLYLQGF